METEDIEIKLKEGYDMSSLIAITGYAFYFAGKKIEGYAWLNYIALILLLLNVLFVLFQIFRIYKNKNQIEKVSRYYIRSGFSLLLNVIIIFSIYTLFAEGLI